MSKYLAKLLLALGLMTILANSISFAANMTVVYIGAKNCPNCRHYEANNEQEFTKILKSKKDY